MVAFKSRFWAALDLPVCLEADDRFEAPSSFEAGVFFEAVAYFEAVTCCEKAPDADVSEADATVDADVNAGLTASSACAEAAAPHAVTLSPISPASEAATDRAESGRDDAAPDPLPWTVRERKAEPDASEADIIRRSVFDVVPDWISSRTTSRDSSRPNHFLVLFLVLFMPPVSRKRRRANILPPGQDTSRAILTSPLGKSIPVGIFLRYSPIETRSKARRDQSSRRATARNVRDHR